MLHYFNTGYSNQIHLKPTMAESAKGGSEQAFKQKAEN